MESPLSHEYVRMQYPNLLTSVGFGVQSTFRNNCDLGQIPDADK